MKLYVTVPPPVLLAVAVNSTLVPAQIAPAGFAEIDTVGVMLEETVIVIAFETAVVAVKQLRPPVMVISTVTWSLFARLLVA